MYLNNMLCRDDVGIAAVKNFIKLPVDILFVQDPVLTAAIAKIKMIKE